MDLKFENVVVMAWGLFGAGHFFIVNANHYSASCLGPSSRLLVVVFGMAIGLLLSLVKLFKSQSVWLHYMLLSVYSIFVMHNIFSVFDSQHIVPAVLVTLSIILVIRHDVGDSMGVAMVSVLTGLCFMLVQWASPLVNYDTAVPCSTTVSVLSLLTGGMLHLFPAAVIARVEGSSEGITFCLFVAFLLYLVPVLPITVTVGNVWVPVFIEKAYVDMLAGGLSSYETVALCVQCFLLISVCVVVYWLMVRTVLNYSAKNPHQLSLGCIFDLDPYFTTVFSNILLACLLLTYQFTTIVIIYASVTVALYLAYLFF